ncbi:MAG: hypothetical protein CMJ83_09535 [Planctomycetes bacterium]|nr:hypothetical protein [Planctomycetota bacterium]
MKLLSRPETGIVALYLLLMIAAGVVLARRNRGGLDYFAGGRGIPWWASGISLYMGNFSAWMFTGGAGLMYRTSGYGLLYFLIIGAASYFIGSQLTAVAWRRSRVLSPVEFTRRRFSIATQQLLSVITSFVYLAAAGNQLRAIATVVTTSLDVPIEGAAIVVGCVVVLYTLLGGLWAVTVTDVVQLVVLLGIVVLLVPLCLAQVPGGLPEVLGGLRFDVPPADDPGQDVHFLIAALISASLGVAANAGPSFYSVPDERSARRAGMLAAALFLTTPVLFSIPPLVARTIWGGPEALATVIDGDDPHERVYVAMAQEVLPVGLVGVFLAAMFAATMSALDSVYNRVAAVFSRDLWMHFRPDTDDRALIRVGRRMTLLCGVITIALCLVYINWEGDLFQVMTTIFFMALPVTAVPVVLGLFMRDAPRGAAMMSIVWGLATAAMTHTLDWPVGPHIYLTESVCIGSFLLAPWLKRRWREPSGPMVTTILGTLLAALAFGAAASLAPAAEGVEQAWAFRLAWAVFLALTLPVFASRFAKEAPSEEVARFHEDLDRPVTPDEVTAAPGAVAELYRLVGVIVALIGVLVLVLMVADLIDPPKEGFAPVPYVALACILAVFAVGFLLAGRRRDTADATTGEPPR